MVCLILLTQINTMRVILKKLCRSSSASFELCETFFATANVYIVLYYLYLILVLNVIILSFNDIKKKKN